MNPARLHIDLSSLAKDFKDYVRTKAITAGGSIIYLEKDEIIQENPKSRHKKILKKLHVTTSDK